MRFSHYIPALLLAIVGCQFNGDAPATSSPSLPDGSPAADSDDGFEALHLLLSEVKSTVAGTEFIEIYNPTDAAIALDDYYLADNDGYASLPQSVGPGPTVPVATSDFIARFPVGASIDPGETLVIGINATLFNLTYGVAADFKIGFLGSGSDMRSAYQNSIGTLAGLTDGGEGLALFYWDGTSDLVVDVDLVIVGPSPTSQNTLVNKTGLSIDGPDSDTSSSSYKTDAATMGSFEGMTVNRESFSRVGLETDAESQEGSGNGRHGHDETTEDTGLTWSIVSEATPGVASITL